MPQGTLRRALLTAVVLGSGLRIVLCAVLHEAPLLDAEASDLQRSMFYHYGLRGHLDYGFWEALGRDTFKPPLFFGGVPVLAAFRDRLLLSDYLLVNAAALLLTCWGLFHWARARWGGDGAMGVALGFLGLPGVAGQVTWVGVEACHMALLVACLFLTVQLRDGRSPLRSGLLLGLCLAGGLLMKWNFALLVAAPGVVVLVQVAGAKDDLRPQRLGALCLAAAVGLGPLLLWLGLVSSPAEILGGAGTEPTFPSVLHPDSLLFYPRHLAASALGLGAAPLILLALVGLRRSGDSPSPSPAPSSNEGLLLAATLLGSLVFLVLIPHKESRYLLPLYPFVVLLLAPPLTQIWAEPRARLALGLAMGWLLLSSLVLPWVAPSDSVAANHQSPPLRLVPDRDDYGLNPLVQHDSLGRWDRNVLSYSVVGDGSRSVLTTLHWAFYARSPRPTVSRYNHEKATDRSCAYDLVRSTHFVTNHSLNPDERAALASLAYRWVARVQPRVPGFGTLDLWERRAD